MSLAESCLEASLQIGTAGAHKDIVAAGAAVRNHFYVNTLAWKGNGDRLLPCKNVVRLMNGHLALKKVFAGLANDSIVFAHFRNSGVANKFYVRLDVDPVVGSASLNTSLDENVQAVFARKIAKVFDQRVSRATADLWSRLIDPLARFAVKMESGEPFRDATVRSLAEAVELLPRLNFADDTDLKLWSELVPTRILIYAPKELRKDKTIRAVAATAARDILTAIERVRL